MARAGRLSRGDLYTVRLFDEDHGPAARGGHYCELPVHQLRLLRAGVPHASAAFDIAAAQFLPTLRDAAADKENRGGRTQRSVDGLAQDRSCRGKGARLGMSYFARAMSQTSSTTR
jgi:hypothetical protein